MSITTITRPRTLPAPSHLTGDPEPPRIMFRGTADGTYVAQHGPISATIQRVLDPKLRVQYLTVVTHGSKSSQMHHRKLADAKAWGRAELRGGQPPPRERLVLEFADYCDKRPVAEVELLLIDRMINRLRNLRLVLISRRFASEHIEGRSVRVLFATVQKELANG